MATVCSMEASYQLAVTEEDLEKCLNYCRSVQPRMMKHLIESIIVIVFLEYFFAGCSRNLEKAS